MLVNGRSFEGTTHYLDAYKHLLASRGNLPWLSECRLNRTQHHQFIHRILYLFHVHRMCFYLTGSYVYYAVGMFDSFSAVGVFMALTEPKSNLLNLIFQNYASPVFLFNGFMFTFLRREPNSDILYFDIEDREGQGEGDPARLRFVFFGVTTTKDCGPESNLDLVHFCWDHAERFSSIKHALLIIPKFFYRLPFGVSPTRTVCLRY